MEEKKKLKRTAIARAPAILITSLLIGLFLVVGIAVPAPAKTPGLSEKASIKSLYIIANHLDIVEKQLNGVLTKQARSPGPWGPSHLKAIAWQLDVIHKLVVKIPSPSSASPDFDAALENVYDQAQEIVEYITTWREDNPDLPGNFSVALQAVSDKASEIMVATGIVPGPPPT